MHWRLYGGEISALVGVCAKFAFSRFLPVVKIPQLQEKVVPHKK
jgi:hypothetical protein